MTNDRIEVVVNLNLHSEKFFIESFIELLIIFIFCLEQVILNNM